MKTKQPLAFPTPIVADCDKGMTLRDYFAAKAMQGDWAAQSQFCGEFEHSMSQELLDGRAVLYYRMADAMLAERAKQI